MKNEKKKVFIGGAWPYANGSLHLGHIAALVPGDVLARYHRAKGADVLYVSGSDCHGTPISVRAEKEGVSPSDIAEKYHNEFEEVFEKLNFSYDIYTKTSEKMHKDSVGLFIESLDKSGQLYEKVENRPYCEEEQRFLSDRYIEGTCECGEKTRGDQCDSCGAIIEPEKLEDIKCTSCGSTPEFKETKHLYYKLSDFQGQIKELLNSQSNNGEWRKNAIKMAERYLKEGLMDRAITRDLDWGIEVPIQGYEDKKIYVWIEAVLGYITASQQWAAKGENRNWEKFWEKDVESYYVHGKDNIPFHTIILPGLLMGLGIEALPKHMVSSEYLTIEGKKISTSKNWAIWANDFLEKYNPDALRYFLLANGPEKRDADFSWGEFVERNNSELLGAYGNFVNRSIPMIIKNFGHVMPEPSEYTDEDIKILAEVKMMYDEVGELIETKEIKQALGKTFEMIRHSNQYFDAQAPWKLVKEDLNRAATVLKVSADLAKNLSNLLNPFIPTTTERALEFLNQTPSWKYGEVEPGTEIKDPEILIERLDKKIIEEEINNMKSEHVEL